MARFLIAGCALLALMTAANAINLGLGNRLGKLGALPGGAKAVTTNFLLINTGSALLINTGSKFLIK